MNTPVEMAGAGSLTVSADTRSHGKRRLNSTSASNDGELALCAPRVDPSIDDRVGNEQEGAAGERG